MTDQQQSAPEQPLFDMTEIVGTKLASLRDALAQMDPQELNNASQPSGFIDSLIQAGKMAVDALKSGNKLMAAGNGGSAAEAQHLTGEIVGRFRRDKQPLPAICLHADTSSLTAISNDFGYDTVFARQVRAFGSPGDVLFLLSTSGRSNNLVEAALAARSLGVGCVALLGSGGGELASVCDVAVRVPSSDPQVVQEVHLFVVHCIAWAIEEAFTGSNPASQKMDLSTKDS